MRIFRYQSNCRQDFNEALKVKKITTVFTKCHIHGKLQIWAFVEISNFDTTRYDRSELLSLQMASDRTVVKRKILVNNKII